MSKDDPQQKKAYDWEDSFTLWAGAHMSEKAAKELVRLASIKYRIKIPRVVFYRSNTNKGFKAASHYNPIDHVIRLRPRHMNAAVILHETAHAIRDSLLGFVGQAHGPEWLGIYMVLLEDFKIATRVGLYASADAKGLKYRKRGFIAPARIRKHYRKQRREAIKEWRDWL